MVYYNNTLNNLNYLYTIPSTNNIINTSNIISTNNITSYFTPPPFYYGIDIYTNVNVDPNLRQMVTEFYLKKTIKWINTYNIFSSYKKILEQLYSCKGYNIIYNLLREFCHKYNIKWYELRENNYNNVKHFLHKKFSTF